MLNLFDSWMQVVENLDLVQDFDDFSCRETKVNSYVDNFRNKHDKALTCILEFHSLNVDCWP